MRPPRPQRKVDNWCPIPTSKSATKPTRESSIRLANFSKNSLPARARKELVRHECEKLPGKGMALMAYELFPARARKELVCHECHAFPRKLFAFDAVAL